MWELLIENSNELQLETTLQNGQSFGWERIVGKCDIPYWEYDDNYVEYIGVIDMYGFIFRETSTYGIYYTTIPEPKNKNERIKILKLLKNYFRLDIKNKQNDQYIKWSQEDKIFSNLQKNVKGVRIQRQDPQECLFSFILSSNNNISRITRGVHAQKKQKGIYIGIITIKDDSKGVQNITQYPLYTFPTLENLCIIDEATFRNDIGTGYRSKYLFRTCQELSARGGRKWQEELKHKNTEEAIESLCSQHGVGRKVASCVALFSQNKQEVVPVDTHVLKQIFNDYKQEVDLWCKLNEKNSISNLKKLQLSENLLEKSKNKEYKPKNVNTKLHKEIGDFFYYKFGPLAGWAHSVLFTSQQYRFRIRL